VFATLLAEARLDSINLAPCLLGGDLMSRLEDSVRASLNVAEDRARTVGAHMMLIGILPTVTEHHLTAHRGPAPDDGRVSRPHALERAGPHLAARRVAMGGSPR
jgi:hypothetical protein